jgi:hypothetical protein
LKIYLEKTGLAFSVAKDSGVLTRVADQRAKKVNQTLKNNNID